MKQEMLFTFCLIVFTNLVSGLKIDMSSNLQEVQSVLESLEELDARIDKENSEESYEKRSDVFNDMRWQNVFTTEEWNIKRMQGITAKQREDILLIHNDLRRQEKSSNMHKLHWNEELAKLGQTWSERCVFEHGQPSYDVGRVGYKDLGQNIYAHSDPKFEVKQAVQEWYNEKKDYKYDSLSCTPGAVCGHYTAVAWADTTEVGCGLTFCPSISGLTKAHFIVCNYGPPGNWGGQKPFLKGTPCTQCGTGKFFCNNDLCDAKCSSEGTNCQCKAACKHCGEKKDCSCKCRPGWTGPDCSEQCRDIDPKCGQNPGYPQMLCAFNDPAWAFVKDKCPKLCGKCLPPDGKPCNQRENIDVKEDRRDSLDQLIGYLEKELEDE